MSLTWALVISALLTMASRYVPLLGRRHLQKAASGTPAGRYLDALPVAVLSALAVQGVFGAQAWPSFYTLAPFIGAGLVAWWSRNLLLTLATALALEMLIDLWR